MKNIIVVVLQIRFSCPLGVKVAGVVRHQNLAPVLMARRFVGMKLIISVGVHPRDAAKDLNVLIMITRIAVKKFAQRCIVVAIELGPTALFNRIGLR